MGKRNRKRRREHAYGTEEHIRLEACRLAADVMCSRPEVALVPTLWSLAVFFESYVVHGSDWAAKPFGPKKPRKLRVVR